MKNQSFKSKYRSSRQEVFCKKGVLRNSAETLAQVFSCEFYEISKNTFSYRAPPVAASESTMLLNQNKKFFKNMGQIASIYVCTQKFIFRWDYLSNKFISYLKHKKRADLYVVTVNLSHM